MCKQVVILHLVLAVFFFPLSLGIAQTLPPEALNAALRIQIVAVSDDKPLEAAEAFAREFSASLDLRAYVIHKDGWYKILLGDFATKADMSAGLKRVKQNVKDAWPVAPDNEKVVSVWEHGKRMNFSQAEPDPPATPPLEILRPRAIREESHTKRKPEALATPTPLPGVIEEDLLATPTTSLGDVLDLDLPSPDGKPIVLPAEGKQPAMKDPEAPEVISPTPAPTLSLTFPEVPDGFEKLAVPSENSVLPERRLEGETDVLPKPSSQKTDHDSNELAIDIDDLQLDEVLGRPQSEGEFPFVIPAPDEGTGESGQDRQAKSSMSRRPVEPVLVKISPADARMVAVGFADGRLDLWDLDTKTLGFRNAGHSGRICDLSFGFQAQCLSSVSVDGSVKVWTLKEGVEQQRLSLEVSDIQDVKFDHANARLLVLHQNTLTAVDPLSGQSDPARQIFPAGEYLKLGEKPLGERDRLVCSPNDSSVLAFDLECCAPVLFQQLAGGIELALPELFSTPLSAAAFSPSAHFFAIARETLVELDSEKAGLEVYQFVPSGKKQAVSVEFLLEVEAGRGQKVSSLAFSPKSSVLLAGHENGLLQLFQLFSRIPSGKNSTPELSARAGKVLRSFEGHTAEVSGLAFFPDGNRFVSVGHDGTLRIWEVKSGQEIQRLNLL